MALKNIAKKIGFFILELIVVVIIAYIYSLIISPEIIGYIVAGVLLVRIWKTDSEIQKLKEERPVTFVEYKGEKRYGG